MLDYPFSCWLRVQRQQTGRWIGGCRHRPACCRSGPTREHGRSCLQRSFGGEMLYTTDPPYENYHPPIAHTHTRTPPSRHRTCSGADAPHLLNPLVEALQPGVLDPNDILWGYFLAQDRSLRTASLQRCGADTGSSQQPQRKSIRSHHHALGVPGRPVRKPAPMRGHKTRTRSRQPILEGVQISCAGPLPAVRELAGFCVFFATRSATLRTQRKEGEKGKQWLAPSRTRSRKRRRQTSAP